nr:hypothetical protein [Edwardsiella ictaluri]
MMGHSCNRNIDSLSHYVAPADWVRDAETRAVAAQGIALATLL